MVNAPKRFSIGLVCLIALVLAAGSAFHSTSQAAVLFDDSFDGSTLKPGWAWENPGGTSSYSISGGRFNLTAGKANDQWVNVNRAPRILKTQPLGNWTIETRINASSANGFTFAGLSVFKDSQNWLLWGWLGNSTLEASGIVNGSFTEPVGVMATKYSFLRIRRSANNYYFDASADGVNWTNANVYRDDAGYLSGARIGIMAKDWNAGSGPSYTVSFDYYREQDQDVMPSVLGGIQGTTLITQETGAASINRTDRVDVCGTDLGISFEWQNRTYFAFGDNRECRPTPTYRRSNSMAFSSDRNPADGIVFDGWITDSTGAAKELFREDPGGLTAIPTGGIGVSDRAYLFYMNVSSWGAPGAWSCNQASIAGAQAATPASWTKYSANVRWGPGNFNQLAVARDGTNLYIWGIPCGRFGSIKLMKVPEANLLQQAAYRYFGGYDALNQPIWSTSEVAAVTVAGGPAGELSVRFNTYLNRWVMTYLDQRKFGIVMREAPSPWGPWSAPIVIASDPPYSQLYGAFMPETNNGNTFNYMLSLAGPYNTFWMQTTIDNAPASPTPTPTSTAVPTGTPTPTATGTPGATKTATPVRTATPTRTPRPAKR